VRHHVGANPRPRWGYRDDDLGGSVNSLLGLRPKFGNYDKSFGSLGAVVVLLTWLYLSAYVVLLGACFNVEMERQTARDTTTGAERPIGQRGANMADTVANDNRAETAQN